MISATKLHEILEFDFEAGRMFWKPRPSERSQWNGRYAGKEAFTGKSGPYRQGAIYGRRYLAHRVIYAAAHGVWPALIDHINQDGSDNRLSNLRAADKAVNAYNSKLRKDSSSGFPGVSRCQRSGLWRAYITVAGAQRHIGHFAAVEDAAAARARAFEAVQTSQEPRG